MKKMTLNKISNQLGFTASQWSNYEQGLSFPKFLDLIKIAKFFEVSETDLIHKDLQINKCIEETEKKENSNFTTTITIQNKLIKIQEEKINELETQIKNLKKIKSKAI